MCPFLLTNFVDNDRSPMFNQQEVLGDDGEIPKECQRKVERLEVMTSQDPFFDSSRSQKSRCL